MSPYYWMGLAFLIVLVVMIVSTVKPPLPAAAVVALAVIPVATYVCVFRILSRR